MKPIFFILSCVLLASCNLKHAMEDPFDGNWYYCDSELGYCEISVSDSLFCDLSGQLFGMNQDIIIERTKEFLKTEFGYTLTLIDKNVALVNGANGVDTARKIPGKFLGPQDYSCEMNLSRSAFQELLWHEMAIRALSSTVHCPPLVPEKWKKPPITFGELDSTFFSPNDSMVANLEFMTEWEVRELDLKHAYPSATISYNADSSRVMVEYAVNSTKNSHFNLDCWFKKSGELIIYNKEFSSGCTDSVSYAFFILLEGGPSLEISRVTVNGEGLNSNQ